MATYKDFYAKDVATAIDEACEELQVSQEKLQIDILETGSAGIFGLCKKKAHIRVTVKKDAQKGQEKKARKEKAAKAEKSTKAEPVAAARAESDTKKEVAKDQSTQPEKETKKVEPQQVKAEKEEQAKKSNKPEHKDTKVDKEKPLEVEAETLEKIRSTIAKICLLMGYPGEVRVSLEETSLNCHIESEHESAIAGQDGRVLDSLQYLLRKMMSRELPDSIILNLDVGDYRTTRLEELKSRALELVEQVKETGKTQAIPALNPSERRVIHLLLQGEKAVRSRSVGDGLFKKILIFKPGKGRKPASRNRRKGNRGRGDSKN